MNDDKSTESTGNQSTEQVRYKAVSRQGQYAKFEPLVDRAIARLSLMLESNNENAVLGALKIIFDRTVPAIKSLEVGGNNGEPIRLNIIPGADYISTLGNALTTSTASTLTRSTEVQGIDMASQGKEDNNSNQSDSEVVST